jgi:protein TonB
MPRKIDLETPVVERLPGLSQAHAKSSEPITVPKAKREITDAQRDHLNKIRELAMKKKAELKEITLKSKLAKTVPKQELAKQYDEYVAQKAVQAVKPKPKPEPKPEPELESEEEETIIVKKPKKKIKKKIIFESESEDEETVVVQKRKEKPPQKQPLENLVYESNKDQLYQRMIEERVKNAVIGYSRSLSGY